MGGALLLLVVFTSCRDHSAPVPTAQAVVHPVIQQPAKPAAESDREKSCRIFVQDFYDWYVAPTNTDAQHKTGELSSDDAVQRKPQLFESKLLKLLVEDRRVQDRNPGYITGLDFDPFTNSQDPDPKYEAKSAAIWDERCRVSVWGKRDGEQRAEVDPDVEAELEFTSGKWLFINFDYPSNKYPWDNLVDILNFLRNERKQAKKLKALG
jgi:hypothetical protein